MFITKYCIQWIKYSIEYVTISISRSISKGAHDMKFSPQVLCGSGGQATGSEGCRVSVEMLAGSQADVCKRKNVI